MFINTKRFEIPYNNVFLRNIINSKYPHKQEEKVKWSRDIEFVTTGNMNNLKVYIYLMNS